MDYSPLCREVCHYNREIGKHGLAPLTWGNASAVDRDLGVMAIKPSGVEYAQLEPEMIVVLQLEDGHVVRGNLKPSSDSDTHRLLYLGLPEIGGIVHTHSRHATAWAQLCRELPCLGTTHADHFDGPVPVTRALTPGEIDEDYVGNTGRVILERFAELSATSVPGVLVSGHGPFTWGGSLRKAFDNAVALEEIAAMAFLTVSVSPDQPAIHDALLARHHNRKHGPAATYGQN
jgi:L-ribulose-5-phosphate 4-epimerase